MTEENITIHDLLGDRYDQKTFDRAKLFAPGVGEYESPRINGWSREDSDPPGYSALHWVSRSCARVPRALESALIERLNIEAEDAKGYTPLTSLLSTMCYINLRSSYAAEHDAWDVLFERLKSWLSAGAKTHHVRDESNALLYVPVRRAEQIVPLLFAHGAGWAPDTRLVGNQMCDRYRDNQTSNTLDTILRAMREFGNRVWSELDGDGSAVGLIRDLKHVVMSYLSSEWPVAVSRKRQRED